MAWHLTTGYPMILTILKLLIQTVMIWTGIVFVFGLAIRDNFWRFSLILTNCDRGLEIGVQIGFRRSHIQIVLHFDVGVGWLVRAARQLNGNVSWSHRIDRTLPCKRLKAITCLSNTLFEKCRFEQLSSEIFSGTFLFTIKERIYFLAFVFICFIIPISCLRGHLTIWLVLNLGEICIWKCCWWKDPTCVGPIKSWRF